MFAAVLLMLAAPAPFLPQKAPPPGVAIKCGEYYMTWCGTKYLATFSADGKCVFADPDLHPAAGTWHGTWRCEKDTLKVVEWNVSQPGIRHTWEAKLASPLAGTMTRLSYSKPFAAGSAWRLEVLAVKWD